MPKAFGHGQNKLMRLRWFKRSHAVTQVSGKAFTLETLDRKLVSFEQEVRESCEWLRCVSAPDWCPRWRWRVRDGKLELREWDIFVFFFVTVCTKLGTDCFFSLVRKNAAHALCCTVWSENYEVALKLKCLCHSSSLILFLLNLLFVILLGQSSQFKYEWSCLKQLLFW